MRKYKLGDIASVEISGVDKKVKDGEGDIRLCNFVDVYYNWAAYSGARSASNSSLKKVKRCSLTYKK